MKIIGREKEQQKFQEFLNSDASEFVVVYGRRRVGKTFLIREAFGNKFDFYHTGIANSKKETQLSEFNFALNQTAKTLPNTPINSWFDAFHKLEFLLEHSKNKGKKIVFLDELPWIDTQKSGFIQALELFWNKWASARNDILLIVCGSATSWLFDKLINNRGGLHNRITQQIYLKPFTLKECEDFFKEKRVTLNRKQIAETYMIFGGIPYYLNFFKKNFSLPQNVDAILFAEDTSLKNEFLSLYQSLFNHSEKHIEIVKALGKKVKGLTRDEILSLTKLTNGGGFSKLLRDLELSGFIRKYYSLDKKEKDAIYQLVDFFTLFYFNFIENQKHNDENYWQHLVDNARHRAWSGFAFEQICLEHLPLIKQKLGISGVLTNVASWVGTFNGSKVQIDLLIDRNDGVINLCEMKFAKGVYTLDKKTGQNLLNKMEVFRQNTKSRKAIHLTMLTPFGILPNEYSGDVNSEIVLDDLFLP
jgi:AAA+ ATPase superfamily predicted ATPase